MRQIYLIIFLCLVIFICLVITLRSFLKEIYIAENFINDSRKKWVLAFGGGDTKFHNAAYRVSNEISHIEVFDEKHILTDTDLKKDTIFWEKHKQFIENNKRGYGYWIWKPYIIMKTLEKMDDNSILLYIDSGCEVISNETSHNKMMDLIERCNENTILYTSTYLKESTWTKMDLFEYMGLKDKKIMDSDQLQAGVIFMKKNDTTLKFTKEWYENAFVYNNINDTPSISLNDGSFKEHRHDQSVFSLLIKKYNWDTKEHLISDTFPILASRKRHG